MADISQTFLLIATFDIALISITIANYAVSASYLGRETRLTRRRLEKRKDQLDKKVKELQAKGTIEIEALKKEIREAEKERKRLFQRIILLSWGGAVIIPCVCFIFSFVYAVFGMNLDDGYLPHLFAASFFLALGFAFLLVVVGTIDSAARQIPIPELDVYFEKVVTTIKANSKEIINVCVKNKGEDVAEEVVVFIHFPPDFILHESLTYEICKQGLGADFPNYTSIRLTKPLMHLDIFYAWEILITAPKTKNNYVIPVYVHERKTGLTKLKLNIEVTD